MLTNILSRCIYLLATATITLSMSHSFAQERHLNPCLGMMDKEIGTLYLCGYGGKFKVLSLDRCHLKDQDLPEVAAYLAAHPRINALDLGENAITGEGLAALANNKTLAWLNVSYNHIDDAGAIHIATISSLKNLDIVASGVGVKGGVAIAGMSLSALDISRNSIGTEAAIALAKSTTLRILSIDQDNVGTEGASALALNTSIAYLYMGWNQINDSAAVLLAKNTHLTELGLESNNIHNEGALALAENTTLTWLYLHKNHIGPAGIAALDNNKYFVEATTDDNDGEGVLKNRKKQQTVPRRQYFKATSMIHACSTNL